MLASRDLSAGAHVIALNPGNGEIACWEDGTLMLRNINDPACRRLDCKGRKMHSAVFLPDNQGLIGLTMDSSRQSETSLIAWKLNSDMPDWVDQTQDHEIKHLANMGTSVIGFCDNGEVMKWHFDAFPPSNPPRTIWKSEGYRRPIVFSLNKDVLAVATRGGGIEIINLSTPTPISLPPLSNAHDVSCMAISNNADVIVACYMLAPPYYSVVRVVHGPDFTKSSIFCATDSICTVSISGDGKRFVTGDTSGLVRLWDLSTLPSF
jgi:WD40 repeat protein